MALGRFLPSAFLGWLLLGGRALRPSSEISTRSAEQQHTPEKTDADDEVGKLQAALTGITRSTYPRADEVMELTSLTYYGRSLGSHFKTVDDGTDEAVAVAKDPSALTYGEILPASFLDMFAQVGARAGMKYYDLGSGAGKTVRIASFLGLDATGIELVEGRHRAACEQLMTKPAAAQAAQMAGGHAKFIFGSFLKYDFSDADMIFADSLTWNDELMAQLTNTARKMKPGSFIISHQGFPNPTDSNRPCFREVKTIKEPTSWTKASSYLVQEVLENDFNQKVLESSSNKRGSFLQEIPVAQTVRNLPSGAIQGGGVYEICDFTGDEPNL
eukprot:CAMPEP_0117473264 /NCGR_PEP_ID=MMETSP0784-20121206/8683_1 /TAXON_ID=39447 /ORGANISM="" /LENGTH=328 /DNA_ID=CAMNT_0005267461 /DNA_START=85 /DNA_END=1071 /DNA_ORIENTATION=-